MIGEEMHRMRWPLLIGAFLGALFFFLLLTLAHAAAPWNCPPAGKGGDPANNLLKNRTTVAGYSEPMPFEVLRYLEVPTGVSRSHRATWPAEALQSVEADETRSVAVVGYLLAVKLEGRESTNCESDDPAHRDFHLWLANSPHDEKSESVVVEIAPRVRANRPGWTVKALRTLVKQEERVRISGYLFLDPEHPEQIGKTRATLWEIHPITQIEVWRAGAWREL